ncbi:MAG: hypothetical protein ABL962_10215, partial [Fimbriimonadaceae bacterium]
MLRGGVIGTEWTISVRGIDSHDAESHWRTTLDYRITPKLSGGLEFNPHTRSSTPGDVVYHSPAGRLAERRSGSQRGSTFDSARSRRVSYICEIFHRIP